MFEGLDIDWFAIAAPNIILHFASGGGFVPNSVGNNMHQINETLLMMPEISPDIFVNKSLREFVPFANLNEYNMYINSFIKYAKRGIFSYDKSVLNDHGDSFYHLVVSPANALNWKQLPEVIRGIIPNTKSPIDPVVQIQIDIEIII